MEENNNEKVGMIDKDVLDVMKQDDILQAISDPKEANRLILNCFSEFLSEIQKLRKEIDDLSSVISVVGSDKIAEFFKQLSGNVQKEEKRLVYQDKVRESHRRPKKYS